MSASGRPDSGPLVEHALARLPVVLWVMDAMGVCTLSVGHALTGLGLREGELVGQDLRALYKDDPDILASLNSALAGNATIAERLGDGRVFIAALSPEFDDDGAVVEVIAISVDITDSIERREAAHSTVRQELSTALHVLSVQESERTEMAEALHDDAIQVLASVDLRSQMLERRLAELGDDAGRAEAAGLREAVHGAVDRLRGLMSTLEPPRGGQGFGATLRDLAVGILQGGGVDVEVIDRTTEAIAEPAARVLYRVAQEALTNVLRHARAAMVVVELVPVGGGWALTVADDGVGPGSGGFAERPGHRGLIGMRMRVDQLGGQLTVHATERGGTEVRAWVPERVGSLLGAVHPDGERLLREMLDDLDDGVVALDRDWRYVYVNRTAAELGDGEVETLEGRNFWEAHPESVGSNFYFQCQRAMAEQRPIEFQDFSNGRWLENRLIPAPQGLVVLFRDVTAERRAWSRPGQAGDAGSLLLSALTASAQLDDPRDWCTSILETLVGSRWFSSARVMLEGEEFASAAGSIGPAGAAGLTALTAASETDARTPGAQIFVEPLLGLADGRIELEGSVPAHLAARWLTRTLAALLTPAVQAVRHGDPAPPADPPTP